MIRSLHGTIVDAGEGWAEIEVAGIGYLVAVPVTTSLPPVEHSVQLHTYLAVRETALDLYGFTDKNERRVFEVLLGVPKVGPKSALQILGQATPSLLYEAAEKNDPVYLQKLSGIGKKTCENVIQHLNNKLADLPQPSTPISNLTGVQHDAIDALIALGYNSTQARDAVLELSTEDATVNTLVTQALKQM